MIKPNLFVVGAPKCGTSALSQYLSEHRSIFFCNPKEPFFLCSDFPHLRRQHFLDTEADYLRLFQTANPLHHKVIAEGSTNYLRSSEALPNALRINSHAKFIAILRNPIDVAHAFHMEQVFARNENVKDFETAWRLQKLRARGEAVPDSCRAPEFLQYTEIPRFAVQLPRLCATVSPDQRLVILHDDMKNDMRQVYRKVLDFLELDDDGRCDFPKVNSAHSHRFDIFADFVLSPPRWLQPTMWRLRAYLRQRKFSFIEDLKKFLRVQKSRPPISPSFRAELLETFELDIQVVEAYFGRSLPTWRSCGHATGFERCTHQHPRA